MNKWEREVRQSLLESEKEALEELEKHYKRALRDIDEKVKILLSDELTQSRAYRLEYQTALHNQISGILEKLHSDEYTTISQFLKDSYNNGFVGTMYDLHGQGVPMLFAVDPQSAVRAVLTDSKLSEPLYEALGIDINDMKKRVSAEITRGIAGGMSNYEIARNLHNASKAPLSRARTIARTESHRIQEAASFDAGKLAKSKGADIVKQWDASLDGDTRETHRALDGKIVELEEPFVSGNNKAMYPGDFGDPAEDCNCRCAVLKRARSALDEEELKTLQERAEFFGLDKTEDFEDFKKKYLKAAEAAGKETEFKEIKGALDFGYGNLTEDDYNKWWDEYEAHNSGVHLSKEELKAIDDYTEGGFIGLNDVCRYSDSELLKKGYSAEDIASLRKKADVLDGALSKYDLDTDIVTHRFERDVSWLTGNGNGIEDLEKLIGTEYTAEGFTSSGMLPNRFRFTGGKSDAVHFEIVTPKGTNGAFLSMSRKGENEFLYNRNTRYRVLDGGERIVKESKFNIKTMQMEEVEIKERFLKVQVIPDDVADALDDVIEAEKLDVSRFPSAFSARSEKKNTENFVEYVNSLNGANPDTIRLYNSMGDLENIESNGIPFKITHGKNHAVTETVHINGDLVEVKINIPRLSGDNLAGQVNTTLHEEMHLMDLYCRADTKKSSEWFSSSRKQLWDVFTDTSSEMSDEVATLFKQFGEEYTKTYDSIYAAYRQKCDALRESYYPNGESIWKDLSKYKRYQAEAKKLDRWLDEELDYQCRNIMGGGINNLQDIYDALSGGSFRDNGIVKYGHGSKEYRRTDTRIHEALANYGALSVTRPDLIEMLRRDKPNLVAELEATIKEMLKKVGN